MPARKKAVKAPRAPRKAGPIPVETTKHTTARRKNIPTADLEALVRDEERAPKTVLYPRNPDLDPQLVWRGKDEQDANQLAVPAVPIYIQEKIAPRAIIEDLRAAKMRAGREPQLDLFGDFNGIQFEDLVQFYQHDQHWTNRMILGDSLLVMTSLAEKEGLKGQVQMMYIDPPYGIKFGSNWQVSTRRRNVRDGRPEEVTRQPEQVRAFRDVWELGIHSYLPYLRDRFIVARDLLSSQGSIFVQIGDENVHLVRCLLDEVFGSEQFVSQISFKTKMPLGTRLLPNIYDHILWYAKDGTEMKFRPLYTRKAAGLDTLFDKVETDEGIRRQATEVDFDDDGAPLAGRRLYRLIDLSSAGLTPSCVFDVRIGDRTYTPTAGKSWKTNPEGMKRLVLAKRVEPQGNGLGYVFYHDDAPYQSLVNVWTDTRAASKRSYVVETSENVIERCVLMASDPGDLVLDPTVGGGTTAVVAERWGRRWIGIDTSRVALAIARTRLMASRFPYYVLADSDAGRLRALAADDAADPLAARTTGDIRHAFVYRNFRKVTLGSVAQNPGIIEGMTQAELRAVSSASAEHEVLFDQPHVDARIVRVSGPLTMESLSPHRMLPEDVMEQRPMDEGSPDLFVAHILDNLRKAGVQNTFKGERLVFEALDTWPGAHVQAMGDYTEGGKSRRVAVSIGPEYGTVGVELVREAAKEAAKAGAETLVVCGFAFDPHVADEPTQFGRLTVLKAKMNPDLLMGDELLKKTGAANLFMIFGEPDIDIRPTKGGEFEVEVKGIDVYDPTTGQVRSHTIDDIATWFVDTNYDGNSFFVRHAYFLGGDDPYEKLQRALRADIDEASWETLYRSTSRPFPRPETGKIAVKVINHYGDEVLKVYPVD